MKAKLRILPEAPMLRRRGALGAILLLFWSMFAVQPLVAQDSAVTEEQLKAAFLYNFVRFVEFPANAFEKESTPITLGVFGNDNFANTLTTLLKDKKAHNRSFVVKKYREVSDAVGAQIVFVARDESRKASSIADTTRKQPLLLIGESDDFLDNGGIINVVTDNKQLKFDIHVTNAEERKLNISSHLLRLARKTKKDDAK